jgi:hypothetical protein
MEELKNSAGVALSDELTRLCNSLAVIAKELRKIETTLDAIVDRKEHASASVLVRMTIEEIEDVLQRSPWRG